MKTRLGLGILGGLGVLLLVGCASSVAEPYRPKVTPADASCALYSQTIETWRDRLGLSDWSIEVLCHSRPDLGQKIRGACSLDLEDRQAAVWISPDAVDIELASIHELLHLVVAQACAAGHGVGLEQDLRMIARAIRSGEKCSCPAEPGMILGQLGKP